MPIDDVQVESVPISQTHAFAAMLQTRGDELGVARQPTRAKILVLFILAVKALQLQPQQYLHQRVRTAACPADGLAEVDHAIAKRCKQCALAQNGMGTRLGRRARKLVISAEGRLSKLQRIVGEMWLLW